MAKNQLLEKGYDAHNGVRPMRRLIQDTIEDHVAMALLNSQYQKGDVVQVGSRDRALTYTSVSE